MRTSDLMEVSYLRAKGCLVHPPEWEGRLAYFVVEAPPEVIAEHLNSVEFRILSRIVRAWQLSKVELSRERDTRLGNR